MKKINDLEDSNTKTLWEPYIQPLSFNKLDKNISTEVLIIGGGIAGITTAYRLLKAGKKVTLVEKEASLGKGQTGNTTAHLTSCLDIRYFMLKKQIRNENAIQVANSHVAAIEWMERTVRLEKINCNFKRINGYLFSSNHDEIKMEFEASRSLGLMTELLNKVPEIRAKENNWCIRFPEQAQLNVMYYLKGLTDAAVKMGANIYANTKAEHISNNEIWANNFKINAEHIIVTANTDLNNELLNSNQTSFRSYVIAVKIPKGKLPYSLWWEMSGFSEEQSQKPYNYARLESYDDLNDILIIGGEDDEISQIKENEIVDENKYVKLFEWANNYFVLSGKPLYKWSGVISYSNDGLAFIGKYKHDNHYIISGDSGNGINYATIGSSIITDSICGKKNGLEDIYSPARLQLLN